MLRQLFWRVNWRGKRIGSVNMASKNGRQCHKRVWLKSEALIRVLCTKGRYWWVGWKFVSVAGVWSAWRGSKMAGKEDSSFVTLQWYRTAWVAESWMDFCFKGKYSCILIRKLDSRMRESMRTGPKQVQMKQEIKGSKWKSRSLRIFLSVEGKAKFIRW